MSLTEFEIRKISDSFVKLREDLLPIYRIVKESKPLPTPDQYTRSTTPPVPSPTYNTPQIIRKVSSKKALHGQQAQQQHAPPLQSQQQPHSPRRNSQDWLDSSFYNSSSSNVSIISKESATTITAGNSISSRSTSTLAGQSQRSVVGNSSRAPSSNSVPISGGGSSSSIPTNASSVSLNVSVAGSMHSEPIKDFNISPDVPCYKILPQIARRHNVRGDWRGVSLVVCYDDQERMIGLEEKPLLIYKELQREGKNPIFMIREDNGLKTDSGFVVNGTPGGLL